MLYLVSQHHHLFPFFLSLFSSFAFNYKSLWLCFFGLFNDDCLPNGFIIYTSAWGCRPPPFWFWKVSWEKVAQSAAKWHGSTAKMYFEVFKIQGSSSNAYWIFPSAVVSTYSPQKGKSFPSKCWKKPLKIKHSKVIHIYLIFNKEYIYTFMSSQAWKKKASAIQTLKARGHGYVHWIDTKLLAHHPWHFLFTWSLSVHERKEYKVKGGKITDGGACHIIYKSAKMLLEKTDFDRSKVWQVKQLGNKNRKNVQTGYEILFNEHWGSHACENSLWSWNLNFKFSKWKCNVKNIAVWQSVWFNCNILKKNCQWRLYKN